MNPYIFTIVNSGSIEVRELTQLKDKLKNKRF